jgi:hypothetical protein
MADAKALRVTRLIAIPTVITLAVTILRLVGELKHWPTPWFSSAAGGGAAIVGIAWLPLIFGPYFALKLAAAGEGPAVAWKAIVFAFLGLLAFFVAGMLISLAMRHSPVLVLVAFLLTLAAGLVPLIGWSSLARVLFAYAFAARLPVLIVMYYAMSANGWAGLGTHYDAVNPMLAHLSPMRKFVDAAILPQMTLWIGWTVILGAIVGSITAAVVRRGKPSGQGAA